MRSKIKNNKFLGIVFFLLMTIFFGGILPSEVKAQEQCNSPYPILIEICKEMVSAIKPDNIQLFKFKYTNPKKVAISIEPKEAFSITKVPTETGSIYWIEITNATLLYTKLGPIYKPVKLSIKETEIIINNGNTIGGIKIDANSRCETIVEFRQGNNPIDLNDLKNDPRAKVEWIYPLGILSEPVITGTQVRVIRLKRGEANLTLIIKEDNLEIARATRPVLDCENLSYSNSPVEGITQIMTPDRCWKPTGYRIVPIENGTEYFFGAENVCTRPISCSFRTWTSHYNSVQSAKLDLQEGNDSRNIGRSDDKMITINVLARFSNGTNGVTNGSWTQQTTKFFANQESTNSWNRFNIPSCVWND